MELGGNLPSEHDALLFSISGTGSFIMASRTDTAGHTKAFDYPVMDHGGGGGKVVSFRLTVK